MDPVIAATLRGALAVLFLGAAVHKLGDLRRFAATLGDYRILPAPLTGAAAPVVVAAELAVAALLVATGFAWTGAIAAAALLLVYGAAIALNLARGRRHLDCGCTGFGARRPISGWLVARNAGLAAVALAGLAPVHSRPLLWIDAITVVGATAVLAAVYTSIDHLMAEAPRLATLRSDA